MDDSSNTSIGDLNNKGSSALGHTISTTAPQEPLKTTIIEQPITQLRKPYVPQDGDHLIKAGVARATIAASKESPEGTVEGNYAKDHQHQTVLISLIPYP